MNNKYILQMQNNAMQLNEPSRLFTFVDRKPKTIKQWVKKYKATDFRFSELLMSSFLTMELEDGTILTLILKKYNKPTRHKVELATKYGIQKTKSDLKVSKSNKKN